MRSRGVTAKLILGTWFMSASCTARLPLCGFLIHVFGPIRREGHDHVRAGAGQGAVLGQVDVQVFTAQALPLGEVFEAAELFVFLQAAADTAFPAEHWQFTGQATLRQLGKLQGPVAADFPALDQALVLAFPEVFPGQACSRRSGDRAFYMGHVRSLNRVLSGSSAAP